MRTWEECKKEWELKLDSFHNSNDEYSQKIVPFLEMGLKPSSFPPIGIRLSVEEYKIFLQQGHNLMQIHGWCWSGKDIHEAVRINTKLQTKDNPTGTFNPSGTKVPRKGFYKVMEMHDDKTLCCYYNYKDYDVFVEEIVLIDGRKLYNSHSIGPKQHNVQVGDVIWVKKDPTLIEQMYKGKYSNAYKIEWDFKVHNWNSQFYDDRPCGMTYEEAERETWDVMTGGMCGEYPGESEEDMFYESLGY